MWRLQYSLRHLFILTTVVAVALGLIVWDPFWGTLAALVSASVVLIVAGITTPRKRLLLCGGIVLLLVAGGVVAREVVTGAVCAWCGSKELRVTVLVMDTDTLEPVSGAKIEVLDGPRSPLESPFWHELKLEFTPAAWDPEPSPLTTDSHGRCEFSQRFRAAGNYYNRFRESGYVATGYTWLRVSAEGRGSVMLPVDGQSWRSRDIKDESTIFVTVPLRKQALD